jgi:hypothetical protein
VWAVPELGRVYASATGEHKLAVVEMSTLKTLAKAGPIDYPDGIAYAPGPNACSFPMSMVIPMPWLTRTRIRW